MEWCVQVAWLPDDSCPVSPSVLVRSDAPLLCQDCRWRPSFPRSSPSALRSIRTCQTLRPCLLLLPSCLGGFSLPLDNTRRPHLRAPSPPPPLPGRTLVPPLSLCLAHSLPLLASLRQGPPSSPSKSNLPPGHPSCLLTLLISLSSPTRPRYSPVHCLLLLLLLSHFSHV